MHLPRRLKRFMIGLLVTVGVIGLVLFIGRASFNRIGVRKLAEITSRLDTEDPGWRLDDIEAARRQAAPPPELNPALIVLGIEARAPSGWQYYRNAEDGFFGSVTNQHPSFQELLWVLRGQAATAEIRAVARTELLRPDVQARPAGHYPLIFSDNPWVTLLPHMDKARSVLSLLDYDAKLAALEGDPDRGIRDARAALVVARSIGDEPCLISQLVRMAGARVAASAAVQVLAWGRPAHGLAELQTELLAEANFPRLQIGLRGERALLDRTFENFQTGKISTGDLAHLMERQPGVVTDATLRFYKGVLPEDRAAALRMMTEYLEAAKLPYHEQKSAFARVQLPPRPPDDFRYILTNLLVPACAKVGEGSIRIRADLLTASVAVACERFRLARGRWPESLAEIPKEILPEIPTDPFDGQLLKYKKLDDGVALFAVGGDKNLARGRKEIKEPFSDLGQGWKLWNPELRGMPAAPEKGPTENDQTIARPVVLPQEGIKDP
ncbi:MAG: hypothetical protein JWO38_6495 [Gemmataceae bacterium]|nr:hypothetical protein [Gemmataceae bacterium]